MKNIFKIIGFLLYFVIANSAYAQLRFCNQTNYNIDVAISLPTAGNSRVDKGWYIFSPGECGSVLTEPLKYRFYYYYAKHPDGSSWSGGDRSRKSCIVPNDKFEITATSCPSNAELVEFKRIDTGDSSSHTVRLTDSDSINFSLNTVRDKACEVLSRNLERPRLRSERIVLARYTDPFTLPQTRTECTNVYDTGVPDPSTCTTEIDNCASEWHGPFGSWGCIPGTTTRCSNMKACNTWRTDKKTMECDLVFQIKLPNYIEKPISEFINNYYQIVDDARREAATSLPLACAPQAAGSDGNLTHAVAQQIADELKEKVRRAIEREAKAWLAETAIQTIVASIPSGGIGGTAVMSTQLGQFVYRTQRALKPIIKVANETKEFAEDLGFSTSCGWSDWNRL
ncbi:DUF1036 domain-containing protein [Methylomonas koyamae]|uniref:DUF1036 domain-containing protein n=1 Tax=Methylomonas koyamae TaxID=702114 RepID=UPI000BC35BB8|nr:DUF1036 domain-containing protein [Methylomonas koyamae]ATG89812.1 hypothetical protein MKLM6_1566 [Methylomonas koyamae]